MYRVCVSGFLLPFPTMQPTRGRSYGCRADLTDGCMGEVDAKTSILATQKKKKKKGRKKSPRCCSTETCVCN